MKMKKKRDEIMIQRELSIETPPESTRQMGVSEINVKTACRLNNMWHSLLPNIHWSNVTRSKKHVCFGLSCNGVLWGVAIFSSPVSRYLDDNTILELRRYALKEDTPRNTGSWGIGQMVKKLRVKYPEVEKMISYQNTQHHNGTLYKASNWNEIQIGNRGVWRGSRKRTASIVSGDKVRWEYVM